MHNNARKKIRLTCIDTPELRGKIATPIRAKSAKGYLSDLIVDSTVTIRRITEGRDGRTIAELLKGAINV